MIGRPELAELTPAERRTLLADLLHKRAGQASAIPLSFAEQRLWFLEQLEPGNPAYNIGVAGQVDGPLDVDALVAAFGEVVRRHEVLRSRYRAVDGRPVKTVAPELPVEVEVEDASGVAAEAWEAELARVAAAELRRPFDLEHGPLLRVRLLRRAPERHVVLATAHHIVFDGWSTLVLLGEVAALYAAFASGEPSPLAPLPIQYADFARWQRRTLRGPALEEQVSYWRQRLEGAPPTVDLPTVAQRPRVQRYRGTRERVALPQPLAIALRDLGRRAGVTLFMTLLAGFAVLLRHLTGRDDIVVGTDTANRNRTETEPLIGFFVNELVLRMDLSGDPTCMELLSRVREVCLGAYAHQDLPFERLIRALRPDRTTGRAPLFQVKLVLQNDWLPSIDTGGLTWRLLEIDGQTAKCELFVSLVDRSDELGGFVEYDTDLFDAPRVRDWFRDLGVVLAAMSADPAARLSAIERTLAAAEREAAALERRRRREASHARLLEATPRTLDAAPDEGTLVATPSPIQERLWRSARGEAAPPRTMCTAVIHGSLPPTAIARAIVHAVARHEALRATFRAGPDDRPLQTISPVGSPEIEILEYLSTDAGACERTLERTRCALRDRPIDVTHGPILHAAIVVAGHDTHLLVLAAPALCADASSLDLLAREIVTECAGTTVPAPVLQHPAVAAWQQDELATGAGGPSTEWPRAADAPTPLARRASAGAYVRRAVQIRLTAPIVAELDALAVRCEARPADVLLAFWQVLLWRLGGQADPLVALQVEGRPFPELRATVGPLERRVPITAALDGSMRALDAIVAARDAALAGEDAAEHVAPPHASDGFEGAVGFAFAGRADRFTAGALSLEIVARESPVEPIALGLSCAPVGDQLGIALEYDASRLDGDEAIRLAGRFEQLVRSALAAPETPIDALDLVGAAERRQLVDAFNDTDVDWGFEACLHELVEAQVARTPGACAVVWETGALTYAELDERANRLAHHLRGLGAGPDVLIGICAERSPELIVGLLGILKAGAAYLPLDPSYPRERLAFMVQDAHPPIVLTQQALLPVLPESAARIVCLDREWDVVARAPGTKPAVDVTVDHLAYVIYTSGSTGRPKGAMNDHRAIQNRLLWMQRAYGLTGADAVLQKTPFSFDVSVWELFWPLLAGARLVFARPDGHRDAAYLVDLIVRERITTAHFVPSMLRVFLEEPGVAACTTLRRVICSGEALAPDLQERFFARLPAELHNLYGPTEAAVDVSAWPCRRGSETVPIGWPIANTRLYVLDARLEPVPLGVPGELYIGGVQVGRGYLNRPELTAERFVPDPFGRRPGARLYRTGDLARHRPDGAVEFLGRLDHQVKIRGLRIELGEIEAVLLRHPGIREAVVHVRESAAGEPRLVAWVVPAGGAAPSARELRDALGAELPEYMVPRSFVSLGSLPLGPSGKIDRRALPEPDVDDARPPYVAPRDDLETRLVAIWEECLDVRPVGVTDDFFDLGGHSLLAVRLLARIRDELGTAPSLASLFEATTVAAQASLLRSPEPVTHGPPLVPIQPRGEGRPFFCVHPAGGHVLCYVPLARALGAGRPFYGLEARGLDGVTAPHTDVPGMASAYLAAIRERQPAGPYLLGGSSFGGVVAFEMAQQLRAAGEEVAFLGLLDTLAPLPGNLPGDIDPVARLRSVVGTITRFVGQTLALPVDEVSRLGVEQQIDYLLATARRERLLPPGCDRALIDRIVEVHKLNFVALQEYVPRVYGGLLTVFRADEISPDTLEPPGARDDLALGWGALSSRPVEVIAVRGDHITMLASRHVGILAEHLRRCLEHASGEAPVPRRPRGGAMDESTDGRADPRPPGPDASRAST